MDPWSVKGTTVTVEDFVCNSATAADILSFEDNFKPCAFDKLPDSDEYLAILGKQRNGWKTVVIRIH